MTKLVAAVVVPPGPGLFTVTCAEPGVAVSVPEMNACRVVAFTKVVARADPFQRTDEFASNPVPATSRVALEDWGRLLGVIPETCGVGALTAKLVTPEVPVPDDASATVIDAVCPLASKAAGTAACRDVELV
jgi:hypothetical protein